MRILTRAPHSTHRGRVTRGLARAVDAPPDGQWLAEARHHFHLGQGTGRGWGRGWGCGLGLGLGGAGRVWSWG